VEWKVRNDFLIRFFVVTVLWSWRYGFPSSWEVSTLFLCKKASRKTEPARSQPCRIRTFRGGLLAYSAITADRLKGKQGVRPWRPGGTRLARLCRGSDRSPPRALARQRGPGGNLGRMACALFPYSRQRSRPRPFCGIRALYDGIFLVFSWVRQASGKRTSPESMPTD
jgi:hypothetical protein